MEEGLREQGLDKPEGLPLEILFTLVTEDGTKRNMEMPQILNALPSNRNIRETDVQYCIREFERIRLLRRFSDV